MALTATEVEELKTIVRGLEILAAQIEQKPAIAHWNALRAQSQLVEWIDAHKPAERATATPNGPVPRHNPNGTLPPRMAACYCDSAYHPAGHPY